MKRRRWPWVLLGIVICLSCIILACVGDGLILARSLWGRELAWGDNENSLRKI